MTVERLKPSGAYQISTIKNGYLIHKTYYFYTRKDAVADFRQFVKTQ